METMFSAAGAVAAVGWLLLVLLPKLRSAQITAGIVIPLLLSALYLFLIVQNFSGAPAGFGSLADVSLLFSKSELLLAGWVHRDERPPAARASGPAAARAIVMNSAPGARSPISTRYLR